MSGAIQGNPRVCFSGILPAVESGLKITWGCHHEAAYPDVDRLYQVSGFHVEVVCVCTGGVVFAESMAHYSVRLACGVAWLPATAGSGLLFAHHTFDCTRQVGG